MVIGMNVLFVMIGGFVGAIGRYALGEFIHTNNHFPLGTFSINMIGCLFLGWFLTFAGQSGKVKPEWTLLIGTGLVGSFTTFSTFSVETIQLFQEGLVFLALLYAAASTVFGLLLAYAGRRLALSNKKEDGVR
ncbi:fluoride efflux transporter CrcB [Bacillus sp. B190/17]|uniref:Fluoride-specific ion channel FluC n=1 Tax=Bacillus lumedeiriae TaxID=3058829 RepID=A0ABW8I819_9BACI